MTGVQTCALPISAGIANSDWLVVPTTAAAAAAAINHAQTLRRTDTLTRVELSLDTTQTKAALRQFASDHKIANIAWVSEHDVLVERPTDRLTQASQQP